MSEQKKVVKQIPRNGEVYFRLITCYDRAFKMLFKELDDIFDYYEFVWKKLIMVRMLAKAGKWELAVKKLELIEEELKDKEKEIDWSNEPSML